MNFKYLGFLLINLFTVYSTSSESPQTLLKLTISLYLGKNLDISHNQKAFTLSVIKKLKKCGFSDITFAKDDRENKVAVDLLSNTFSKDPT